MFTKEQEFMTFTDRTIRYSIALLFVALVLAIPAAQAVCQSIPNEPAQDPGAIQTVTKVSIIGGHDVNRKLVLARFDVHPGDTFDADACEQGIEMVTKLSGVESAFLRILPDHEGDGMHLVIVISDADTRIMRPALSRYLTNDWSFGFRFEESNFRGMDEKVKSLLLLGGATIVKASWLKPFFPENLRLGVGLSAGYEQYDYPYPDYGKLLTDDRIKRFQAAGGLRLNITEFAHLSVMPGVDVIEVADTISYDERVPAAPNGTFMTVEVVLSADLRDRLFYPSSGFIVEGGRKDWGVLQSGSEMKNFLYWADGTGYLSLWRFIGVLHSRASFTQGDVPLLLLEHLGGEGSIRGYDFGIFSGENSLIATAEARFPLNFDDLDTPENPIVLVDFHLFLDSGACWSGTEGFDQELLHSGFGCGVNVMPGDRGLISVEYAWQLETAGMWHVNAGFYF
jgi:outer membrane protein assembly factor BamA